MKDIIMADSSMDNKEYIRLCIVEDDLLYRDSIRKILAKDKRIHIFREFSSALPLISLLNSPFLPDVCLIDIVLPEMSGLECASLIHAKKPDIHIILMTAHPSPESFAAAKRINADYIQKGTLGETLMDKMITNLNSKRGRLLSVGRSDEKMSEKALKIINQFDRMQKNLSKLSKVQREVLKFRQENKSLHEISEILNISPNTVGTHIHRGLEKLQIPNLLEYIDMEK